MTAQPQGPGPDHERAERSGPSAAPAARLQPTVRMLAVAEGTSGPQQVQLGEVVNLSATGVFLASASPWPVGTAVRLSVALPLSAGARRFVATGVVRWVNDPAAPLSSGVPPGMGLELVRLDTFGQAALDAFLDELRAIARTGEPRGP